MVATLTYGSNREAVELVDERSHHSVVLLRKGAANAGKVGDDKNELDRSELIRIVDHYLQTTPLICSLYYSLALGQRQANKFSLMLTHPIACCPNARRARKRLSWTQLFDNSLI